MPNFYLFLRRLRDDERDEEDRLDERRQMAATLRDIDVYVAPTRGGSTLVITNLTGHPAVVLPNGFDDKKRPTSITFIGNLFEEGKTLRVAKAYQDATDFHRRQPPLTKVR